MDLMNLAGMTQKQQKWGSISLAVLLSHYSLCQESHLFKWLENVGATDQYKKLDTFHRLLYLVPWQKICHRQKPLRVL